MSEFLHQRHKSPSPLQRLRELVVALPILRSNVNLSRIVRLAGCCGITRVIACGRGKIDAKIARDAMQQIELIRPRSLAPALQKLSDDGYQLVGLEQVDRSQNLHEFTFPRRTALVIGHERLGITAEVLRMLDAVVEIPVWGLPYSYNVATATTMAVYEYCRQYPRG